MDLRPALRAAFMLGVLHLPYLILGFFLFLF